MRKIKERGSANAKAQNLRPKKERESASVQSSVKERESASAKRKKSVCPALAFLRSCIHFIPEVWDIFRVKLS